MFDSEALKTRALGAMILALLLAPPLYAQKQCPPLPEGVTCDHYHYHVSIWNLGNRTYEEVAGTRQFVSVAACDAARAADMKQNQALTELVKTTKIDTSILPNRYSNCHCDLTQEPSSPAFLDARARLAQLRAQQDAAWSLRERLLSHDVPGVVDHVNVFFERLPRLDRFFRESFPPRLQAAPASRPATPLLDTTKRSEGQPPAIAANRALAPVTLPALPPASAAQPQPGRPAAQPAAQQPAAPPAPAGEQPPATTSSAKPPALEE